MLDFSFFLHKLMDFSVKEIETRWAKLGTPLEENNWFGRRQESTHNKPRYT
jgi:hypothetical protein